MLETWLLVDFEDVRKGNHLLKLQFTLIIVKIYAKSERACEKFR